MAILSPKIAVFISLPKSGQFPPFPPMTQRYRRYSCLLGPRDIHGTRASLESVHAPPAAHIASMPVAPALRHHSNARQCGAGVRNGDASTPRTVVPEHSQGYVTAAALWATTHTP